MERVDAGCSHLRSHPVRSFAPASADAAHYFISRERHIADLILREDLDGVPGSTTATDPPLHVDADRL